MLFFKISLVPIFLTFRTRKNDLISIKGETVNRLGNIKFQLMRIE